MNPTWNIPLPDLHTNTYPLQLQTQEGDVIPVPEHWKEYSPFLQSMSRLNEFHECIPLEYSTQTISFVSAFYELYPQYPLHIQTPIVDQIHHYVSPPYVEYLHRFTNDTLFETLHVACYFQMEMLIEFLSCYIASLLLDKSPREIEELFDLTPVITEEIANTLTNEIITFEDK